VEEVFARIDCLREEGWPQVESTDKERQDGVFKNWLYCLDAIMPGLAKGDLAVTPAKDCINKHTYRLYTFEKSKVLNMNVVFLL
jgi:hypothetical protein